MLRTISRLSRVSALALGFVMFVGVAPPAASAAEPFAMDVYFRRGYERQVDNRTCTAAATAMMLNFIAGRDLGMSQMGILRYEQPRDALNNAKQRGSDPLGWARALTYYSTRTGKGRFAYNWEAYSTEHVALRRAAKLLAYTGKPVGLLVWHGRHAMVMTGFEATADPRRGAFTLTHVWISDPYGSRHRRYTAAGSPLDTYRELDATPAYDRAWYGRYVIVAPQTPKTPTSASPAASTTTPINSGPASRPESRPDAQGAPPGG